MLLLASGGDVPHCGTAQVPLEPLLDTLALEEALAEDDVPPSLPVLPPVKVDPVVDSGAVVVVVPSPVVDVREELAPAELVATVEATEDSIDALAEDPVPDAAVSTEEVDAAVSTEEVDAAVATPLDAVVALESEDEALGSELRALRELLPSELRSELSLRPPDDAELLAATDDAPWLDSADDPRLSPSDRLVRVDARPADVEADPDSALRDPPALREAPDTDEVTDMPQTHAS